jgi:hypothetical protein
MHYDMPMLRNRKTKPPREDRPDIDELVREHLERAVDEIVQTLEGHAELPEAERLLERAYVAQRLEGGSAKLKVEFVTEARGLAEAVRATWSRVANYMGYRGAQQAYNAFAPGKEVRDAGSRVRAKKTRVPAPEQNLPGWSGLQAAESLGVNRNTVSAWGRSGKLHTYPVKDVDGNIEHKPKGDPAGKPVFRYYLDGMNRAEAARAMYLSEAEVDAMADEGELPSAPVLGEGGKVVTGKDGEPLRWYWPEHID